MTKACVRMLEKFRHVVHNHGVPVIAGYLAKMAVDQYPPACILGWPEDWSPSFWIANHQLEWNKLVVDEIPVAIRPLLREWYSQDHDRYTREWTEWVVTILN